MQHLSTAKKNWIKLYRKITGENSTPEYAARGWALGMFCGFFIPIGAQLIVSVPMSFIIKGSRIGAVLGTLATNQVTVFFIYPMQCWLGNLCLGGNLTYQQTADAIDAVVQNQEFDTLMSLGYDIILSFFIGGAILAAITTPLTYIAVLRIVKRYQERMSKRKQRRTQSDSTGVQGS